LFALAPRNFRGHARLEAPQKKMTTFPEDALKRIGEVRRRAESNLKASLALIDGDDITPYLLAFNSFAIAVYDAEA
jgi:hypothetical protein